MGIYYVREIEEKDNRAVEAIIRFCLIEVGGNREGTAWTDPNLGIFSEVYREPGSKYFVACDEDGKTVAACDCLVPGIGEIIGGSQREERLDVLKARMAELGLKEEDYWWYLELRKYGETKHAGFGLGFERLIMYITGMSNIRDVIPFPRTTGQSDF